VSSRGTCTVAKTPRRGRVRKWLTRVAVALTGLLLLCGIALAVLWYACPFPISRLDHWPVSPKVTDRNGVPLLMRTSPDEQWRFPVALDEMSPWLTQATIAVEDRRFRRHPGVDLRAVTRAAMQNLVARRTVSGASTLTMQICRMMDDRPRTLWAKLVESFRAMQLERIRSKDEILACYLNLAPYGRNFRGVEAASWAYFGKRAKDLSLDEAALLAGLPQSPSRLRPDRFPQAARKRRASVLRRMASLGMISERQRRRAEQAEIALSRRTAASLASHAAIWALKMLPEGGRTTLDAGVQREVERLAAEHAAGLPEGSDLAILVLDIARREVISMVGSADPNDPVDGQVNGALAWRSPGSALKPFIYAAAFEARRLAPESIVYDVPIHRAGWSPENFDRSFVGELTAGQALRRSLNVPAILVAEGVGMHRCVGLMEAAGVRFQTRRSPGSRGGLALAVGAVEVRLLDLTNAYATLGAGGVRMSPRLFADEARATVDAINAARSGASARVLDPKVCAAIDEVLSSRRRRPRSLEAFTPGNVPWFMWKTGTSSGRRDAWAVGHNRRFAVGVWVGRFCGTGRPEYVGSEAAEPLLAQLFLLPCLRARRPPVPPMPWRVARPLHKPVDLGGALRVLAPHDGATFLAVSGDTTIHPQANGSGELTWFLNGTLLAHGPVRRLVLTPGQYRLRCVDLAGNGNEVEFTVRNR
jgi:penicillin-binding protein 1C